MKTPHYAFSKKFLPRNAKRITNEAGERVWLINGREYPSKRAYFEAVQARAAEVAEKIKVSASAHEDATIGVGNFAGEEVRKLASASITSGEVEE
jgi:hypothetical protein